MTDTVRVYVSIGSNIDRRHNIRSGVKALRNAFGPVQLSRVYESNAVGFRGENFYNLVARFETTDDVYRVESILTEIEDVHGRDRSGPRFAPRTLDLDLLLYGDLVCRDQVLEVPREEITRYAFVLLPLAEIAPDLAHPITGRRFDELWKNFEKSDQTLWPVEFDWESD